MMAVEVIAESLAKLVEPITALRPDPRNARKHNEKNLAAVRTSLTRFGQVKPIVVDADGVVLAGNGTLEAAKALSWKRLAVVRVPLTGADARAYALADNRTAELAEWDWEELAAQAEELGADALVDVGWDAGDLEGLLAADLFVPSLDASLLPEAPRSTGAPLHSAPDPVGTPAEAVTAQDAGSKKLYTTKAETPIYIPRGERPDVSELVDSSKTQMLLAEIDAADAPADVKDFLRRAAYRHDRFNFKQIAEFYAHAAP